MKPGATSLPVASIVRAAGSVISPAIERDATVLDADIGAEAGAAGAVHHGATVDHDVQHGDPPSIDRMSADRYRARLAMYLAGVATLDWYGCATFRLRTGGLTVFLDAYIDRAPDAAGTGLTADDVDECDWIVIGHAHFDHLYGAERIMARTNATLIGSYESVRVMEAAGRARRPA